MYEQAKRLIQGEDNLFCNGAKPVVGQEQGVVKDSYNPDFQLEEREDGVYLLFDVDMVLQGKLVDGPRLGETQLSGLPFEHFDGTPFQLEKDYFGTVRSKESPVVGPIETLQKGKVSIKVW